MVEGIVMIGQQLKLEGYFTLMEKVPAPILLKYPVESAYPFSFEKGKAYVEGILVHACSKEEEITGLEHQIKKWLIKAAQKIEEDYCKTMNEGGGWDASLYHEQLASTNPKEEGLIWIPHCLIIKECQGATGFAEYQIVANDLIRKTRDKRIAQFKEIEKRKAEISLQRVSLH